jgi:3-oxoisoapionate decarboxylase
MNLKNITLNFYSFGFYGGLIKTERRSNPILGVDELVKLASNFGLGGIEIPLDRFYSLDQIDNAVEKIEQIQNKNFSVFIDLENTNVEYISRLVPHLPALGMTSIRIKMDQIGRTIYGGNRYTSETFNKAVKKFKQQLVILLPSLEKYNITLAIENHQDFHSSELVELSKTVSNELIGVTWDIGNSISVIDTPETFYDNTHNIIKNVHLKDYKVYKSKLGFSLVRCPLGEGYVDYHEVMKKISNNGNIINMSIELGAQSPRQCDIGNQMYWEKFSDIPIDKEHYLTFVNEVVDKDSASYSKPEKTEDEMIESELNDIEKSVNNLKQILEKIK